MYWGTIGPILFVAGPASSYLARYAVSFGFDVVFADLAYDAPAGETLVFVFVFVCMTPKK